MVYFGIEDSSKAHMMYNPQNNKIVVSRDVVFEEVVMWSWDAVETEDFSVELENGQFFPQIIWIVLDDHRSGDLGGADSGGQHSVTGEVLNQQELGVI